MKKPNEVVTSTSEAHGFHQRERKHGCQLHVSDEGVVLTGPQKILVK